MIKLSEEIDFLTEKLFGFLNCFVTGHTNSLVEFLHVARNQIEI